MIADHLFGRHDSGEESAKPIIRKTKVTTDIGIAVDDFDFDVVIGRGAELPAVGSKNYYLLYDGQSEIAIKVYSRPKGNPYTKVTRCDYLDTVKLTDIPELKKRDVAVIVTFTITEEYEMQVSAEIQDHQANTIVNRECIRIKKESND